ncbi:MAG: lamin tail domain-containing protein, partial [Verrucomicrobiota bacterium]
TFSEGTLILPGAFLVVADDRIAFASAYGSSIPVAGEFGGRLQNNGETLKLVKPGPTPAEDVIVSQTRYEGGLPWPAAADGSGASLQLRDPLQDTARVANWAVSGTNIGSILFTPGAANSVRTNLPSMPPLWINEILPNNIGGLADGLGHREPWIEIYNPSKNPVSLDGLYLTDSYTNLTVWPFPTGTTMSPKQFLVVWADGKPNENAPAELHTSFRLPETTGSVALVWTATGQPLVLDYLNYSTFSADRSYGSYPDGQPFTRQVFPSATPGGTNNPASTIVPVVINEFMASNTRTLLNCARVYDDWIELYNTSSSAVDLSGYFLTDNLTNSTKWSFPQGTFIGSHGYLLVWADDQLCSDADVHAAFKLSAGGEQIGLFAPDGRLIDGMTFPNQKEDVSYGRFPDGAGSTFFFMEQPTPRGANVLAATNSAGFLATAAVTNNVITISWPTTAGRMYRVEFSTDLNTRGWQPLGPNIATVSSSGSITDTLGPTQRFYRVLQLD